MRRDNYCRGSVRKLLCWMGAIAIIWRRGVVFEDGGLRQCIEERSDLNVQLLYAMQ